MRLLVFDWDGTLMDSVDVIADCLARAFHATGLPVPDRVQRLNVIGLGLAEAMARLSPGLPPAQLRQVAAHYRDCFLAQPPEATPFFPGVEAGLSALHARGYRLAVATGKARAGLDRLFARHPVCELFASSRCAGECPSKPAPDMLLEIMAETGIRPEQTLMIGDSVHDMEMARRAGVGALGLAHGANDAAMLERHGARATLAHFAEIHDWLASAV